MFNRRTLVGASIATAAALTLSACGNDGGSEATETNGTVVVAATPVPHADILNFISENLAEDAGLTIEVQEFTDYVQPNVATADGSVDANFFQTEPYLDEYNAANGTDLTTVAPVHIEPLGLYSNSVASVDEIPNGAQIAIPGDGSNGGRALALLADAGLITLADGVDVTLATEDDIADNPKNLEFVPLEAAQLALSLEDVDAAVINGNYALEADLSPAEDALFSESPEGNPYANYLVTTAANADNPDVQKLAELLQSDEVKQFILDTWSDGSVIPAS
ncbi:MULTISPECIES: MetQ/NlpA family ABC transporter substrate-binding protein [Glycomyces]|uniref:Lipoprotein n=2 Tax=Glycomyces TaxID=58113 RepID=A0A9X3PX87_9ACTN|nr:MetQ/NlpA family ABC transporter substrate-binding protein [Glycomyces lechevalierae]MDA1387668.1 MetQ/NlpA family ABC transporter substrate-binding protein [Glycomyces lechevalierae]MDR7337986.1 D-methionine transport system substrate-binding protein [Glycomyces lechevalierae]